MNFEDYMKKIQYISNLLENNNYPENILNDKGLNIKEDFQYICLSSASNYKLVNEVIARLAQNGNKSIVEENIKNISISMWKGLFNINEATKSLFVQYFDEILDSAIMISYREIEDFINDKDTCSLIYKAMPNIIKKLSTYDRAALINHLKIKNDGEQLIKENINNFFKKGDFDISTTYSKILIELSYVNGISKIDILKACSAELSDILVRETAIDNETSKLLNWIYDAYEENKMMNQDRIEIKKVIDNAILNNFEYILDKSNYDKESIKSLKQFDCTKDLFEKNKNLYIDKSNKLNNYNEQKEKSTIKEIVVNSFYDKNVVNFEESVNEDSVAAENVVANNECENSNIIKEKKLNEDTIKLDYVAELKEQIQNRYINKNFHTNKINEIEEHQFEKNKTNVFEDIQKDNIINFDSIINSPNIDEGIKKLIQSNISETDAIINRVMKKEKQKVVNISKNEDWDIQINDENYLKLDMETKNNVDFITVDNVISFIEENADYIAEQINIIKSYNGVKIQENVNVIENIEDIKLLNSMQNDMNEIYSQNKENNNLALISAENSIMNKKRDNIFVRAWKKIKKLFGLKGVGEEFGE